jgi:hypothetical protein
MAWLHAAGLPAAAQAPSSPVPPLPATTSCTIKSTRMELTATETFLDGLKAWRSLNSGSNGELRQPIDGLPDGLLERDAPVSYAAYIDLSRKLKAARQTKYSLENMLRGARVYVAPPPPKKEPVGSSPILSDYKLQLTASRHQNTRP